MKGWNELWRALRIAIDDTRHTEGNEIAQAGRFLGLLEDQGFTIMPLEIRRAVDLWGTAVITKTMEGYALIDPTKVRIES